MTTRRNENELPEDPRALIVRWISKDADLVAHIAAEILREEAWWIAARTGKFAHPAILHADENLAQQTQTHADGNLRRGRNVSRRGEF